MLRSFSIERWNKRSKIRREKRKRGAIIQKSTVERGRGGEREKEREKDREARARARRCNFISSGERAGGKGKRNDGDRETEEGEKRR